MIHLTHPNHPPQKLRWTDQHPASSYGLGVLLRGHGGEILDGATFKKLTEDGYKIICSTDMERRRVAGALAWGALGLDEKFLEIA
jgi:hypothetical protein